MWWGVVLEIATEIMALTSHVEPLLNMHITLSLTEFCFVPITISRQLLGYEIFIDTVGIESGWKPLISIQDTL